MKIDLLENGCLKILLTEDDLKEFHLTFEDPFDYNNDATRSAMTSFWRQHGAKQDLIHREPDD